MGVTQLLYHVTAVSDITVVCPPGSQSEALNKSCPSVFWECAVNTQHTAPCCLGCKCAAVEREINPTFVHYTFRKRFKSSLKTG